MNRVLAVIGLCAATIVPIKAQASTLWYDIDGPGVKASLTISYMLNPNTGPLPGTIPNPVDPIGSYIVTGISGAFSDTNLGIANATVAGLAPLNRVTPEPGNTFAPNSFSLLTVKNGVPADGGVSPGLHFDNLFYPAGSPQTAKDYPFSGGLFDIYGAIFKLNNGDYVNLWSNGSVPKTGLNYGVAVTDRINSLDYVGGVAVSAVPEPGTWFLMIAGIGMAGSAMRRHRRGAARLEFA